MFWSSSPTANRLSLPSSSLRLRPAGAEIRDHWAARICRRISSGSRPAAVALRASASSGGKPSFEQRHYFPGGWHPELVIALRLTLGKAGADQVRMVAGEHGDADGVIADQFSRRRWRISSAVLAVVGQRRWPRDSRVADTARGRQCDAPAPASCRRPARPAPACWCFPGRRRRWRTGWAWPVSTMPSQDCGVVCRSSFLAAGKPALAEGIARQAEVIHRQLQGVGHAWRCRARQLGHDADLPGPRCSAVAAAGNCAFLELQLPVGSSCRVIAVERIVALVQAQDVLFVQARAGARS